MSDPMRDPYVVLFDGRTLAITVVIDVRTSAEVVSTGALVQTACRGPLERMAFGTTMNATDAERAELGSLLALYDRMARTPICVKHKFILNTDEDVDAVAIRLKRALDDAQTRCLVMAGLADPDEAAPLWRMAIATMRQHTGTPPARPTA